MNEELGRLIDVKGTKEHRHPSDRMESVNTDG